MERTSPGSLHRVLWPLAVCLVAGSLLTYLALYAGLLLAYISVLFHLASKAAGQADAAVVLKEVQA